MGVFVELRHSHPILLPKRLFLRYISSRSSLYSLHLVFVFLFTWLFCDAPSYAQDYGSKGYIPSETYHSSAFDSVNLSNGNLVLDITLITYRQRGTLPSVRVFILGNGSSGGFADNCGSGGSIDNSDLPSVRTSPFLAPTSYQQGGNTCPRDVGGY
jgi:hypothetical protein